MKHHITQLPHSSHSKDGRRGIELINNHGEMIAGYDVIFRELFCLAAAALGDRLREHLTSVGVLWDEILPTGKVTKRSQPQKSHPGSPSAENVETVEEEPSRLDMAEKGLRPRQEEYGSGSLMFLVRRVETDREAERLVAAGYRFAEPHQVSEIIRTSMQIQSPAFESKIRDMVTFADHQNRLESGIHLGFFAVRARVHHGFEILVRKGARNLLPSMALPMKSMEQGHIEFLRHLDGLAVPEVLRRLKIEDGPARSSEEVRFAKRLDKAIKTLREWIQEPLFEDAVLTSTVVRLPFRNEGRQRETVMMVLRLVIPIHSVISSPNCEWVPLSFFKMRQILDDCQQDFMRGVHREFGPIVRITGRSGNGPEEKTPGFSSRLTSKLKSNPTATVIGRRSSSPDSTRSSSTINLCPPGGGNRSQSMDTVDDVSPFRSRENSHQAPPPPSYGGIMVFQEITINVEQGQSPTRKYPGRRSQETVVGDTLSMQRKPSTASGIELRPLSLARSNVMVGSNGSNNTEATAGDASSVASFVDVLFAECVESR